MTLPEYEQLYISRKQKKLFWSIIRGFTGQSYKKLNEIPEEDVILILKFIEENTASP